MAESSPSTPREVRVWFDLEGDMLEVHFEDAPATLEEVGEDLFERRTPDGRVIGFTVLNVSRHDRGSLTLPLNVTAAHAA